MTKNTKGTNGTGRSADSVRGGDFEALVDLAAAQIRDAAPPEDVLEQAAGRVWRTLSADLPTQTVAAASVEQIESCEDYQALMPALLDGSLPQARRLLVEDHSRECVPCRRALTSLRRGGAPSGITQERAAQPQRTSSSQPWLRWGAIAASLVSALGVGYFVTTSWLAGSGARASVAAVDGSLFRVSAASQLPVSEGAEIREGERIRSGRDGGSVIELEDGSLVELRERSEFYLDESRSGTTIRLERGSVIVQAAPQRSRHLFVSTEDCLVSVTGTIFSVNHGTRGSRVSVIEGEVRVAHGGDETVLAPGQQVATHSNLETVSVGDEIAWSRDLDHYLELLGEYTRLQDDLAASVSRPELRYESRLLELVPADTALYAAVPNLSQTIRETHTMIRERLAESPALAEWMQSQGSHNFENAVEGALARFAEFGDYLGSELVVSGHLVDGEMDGPLVLAEVVDPAGLRDFVERQLAEEAFDIDDGAIVFVDDFDQIAAGDDDRLLIWVSDGVAVASPSVLTLREVAARMESDVESDFVGRDFHHRISQLYSEGAEILVAADLQRMIPEDEEDASDLDRLGFLSAQHLMVEQKQLGERTHHRAVLTFSEARHGLASWLASPAPMGSLDFVSPDAKLVAAFVFEDPTKLLDDIVELGGEDDFGAALQEFEAEYGVDIRADLAETLGGEFAIALDGPMLPIPSWKVIVEVYDPARFQWTLEQGLAAINDQLAQEGEELLSIEQESAGGRTYYSMPTTIGELEITVTYTFVEGYLVIAPNRALLDRSIRFAESGYGIAESARFASLLPADGHNNFSALVYQDMASVVQAVAERLSQGELGEEAQQTLDSLGAKAGATLGYAYGESDRIIIAAASEGNMLSSLLMRLLGLKDPAGLEQMLAEMTAGIG